MQPRKLYIDTDARTFVESDTATLAASVPLLFGGDTEAIELYFLKQTGDFNTPYSFANYSSGITATFALGVTNAASTITSWSAITTSVTITASTTITGGSGLGAVQKVEMSPEPATGFYSLQLPTRNVTVSSVTASTFVAAYHALLDGQSVTLTGFTTPSGFTNGEVYYIRDRSRDTFKIAATAGGTAITASVASAGGTAVVPTYTTQPLAARATPVEISTALAAAAGASTPQIAVQGTPISYNLVYNGLYSGANLPTVAVTASTLAGPPGLRGNVNMGIAFIALVANGPVDGTVEVEITDGTLKQTYQAPAQFANDL